MGAPSRKQRRSQPAFRGSSLCCAGQRRRHAEHHGRLLLRRSSGRGPRGCAAGLLHLLTSGHSVGRLPNRNGAGRGDDQRHHGRAAGLLHRGASGRAVGRLPHGERAGHADAGRHRGRAAGLPDGPGPGRVHHQPNHLGAGGVPLSRRPGHGDGLEHRRRPAQLLHHRTSRRPPCGQARSHGGGLCAADSSALSGRRRGRRGGGRHRRADPGPHGRLAVKLDGSPQQRLQRGPGHAHRGSKRGRLHPDPGGEPVEHRAHLQLDARQRAALRLPLPARHGLQLRGVHVRGRQRLRPLVRQLRGRPGRLEHGQDVLHSAAQRSGEACTSAQPNGWNGGRLRPPDPGRNLETGNTEEEEDTAASALLLKHEFLDGGADDVTLATLGEVLLEPTLTTLGNFLVRSNSQSSVASASFAVGGFQLEGYAMTLSAFAWNIVRTYTLTPGRRYSFGCRYRLGTASNLVMYVSAADNDYVGVTGTFLGTPSQGVWSTARLDFSVPPGGIAKLHFGAFGGSIPGLVQQSAGTLDLYSMQIRASAFEGESVSVTDLLADSLALTGSATLDGLTAQGNVGCDQLLCNDVNCTDVFTTGVDASGAVSCAALTATGTVAGAALSSTGGVSGSSLSISGAASVGLLSSATGITGSTLTINNTANAGNFTTVGDVSTGTLTASGAATAASFAATGALTGATLTITGAASTGPLDCESLDCTSRPRAAECRRADVTSSGTVSAPQLFASNTLTVTNTSDFSDDLFLTKNWAGWSKLQVSNNSAAPDSGPELRLLGNQSARVFLERDGGTHQCELIMINDEALVQTKSLSTQLSLTTNQRNPGCLVIAGNTGNVVCNTSFTDLSDSRVKTEIAEADVAELLQLSSTPWRPSSTSART